MAVARCSDGSPVVSQYGLFSSTHIQCLQELRYASTDTGHNENSVVVSGTWEFVWHSLRSADIPILLIQMLSVQFACYFVVKSFERADKNSVGMLLNAIGAP